MASVLERPSKACKHIPLMGRAAVFLDEKQYQVYISQQISMSVVFIYLIKDLRSTRVKKNTVLQIYYILFIYCFINNRLSL